MNGGRCPNINHPDWKKLVDKVGVDNAYLAYIRNNYEIPTNVEEVLEDIPSKHQESALLLPGFESFYQQNEAINVLSSSVMSFFRNHPEIKAGAWKKAIETFKSKIEEANKEKPNKAFKAILDNFNALEELAHKKLQLLGLRKRTRLDGISLDTYKAWMHEQGEDMDNMDEQDVINSWKDEWVFQFDAKDNALKQVKTFLAFIPKSGYDETNNEFYTIDSFIPDEPSFMSYDEVYEQLKSILSGVENTWEAMEAEMLKHEKAKPFIHEILNYTLPNYTGDIEQLKRQFVSTMSASYGGFKTILIKEINGEFYFNTIDTDTSSIQKTLLSQWSGEFKRTELFNEDEEGNLVPNEKKLEQYFLKIEEAKANPTKENVKELLKGIGIDISETSLTQLVESKVNKKDIEKQFTDTHGLFKLIEARLKGKVSADENDSVEEDTEAKANNPIVNNSAITGLARLEARNAPYAYSNTFRDGEGNTIYSYTFNKFLTKEFIKLQTDPEYVKQLLQITFNKPIVRENGELLYNTWLNQLANNPVFNSIFNISPFDTVRLQAPGKSGTKLTEMGELDLELTRIALMQNSGKTKKGIGDGRGRVIKYLLTVPSKTTSYIIQGSGQDVKLLFDDKGTYKVDPKTKDAIYNIIASEYNRILSQQARKNANKAYDKGSTLFYFFPELNGDPNLYDETGKLLLPTTITKEGVTIEQYLRKRMMEIVHQSVLANYRSWKDLGIIREDGSLHLVDRNYKNNILNEQSKGNKTNETTLAVVDYVINSMLAKFNVHQTFIDDPAIYYKANKENKTPQGHVDETWANVGKRLTNLIAPFKDGMLDEENKHFLSVKIEDKVVNALNHSQLKARLANYYEEKDIKFPYENITGTDGQEYTTLTESLRVMYMYGYIDTKTYKGLLTRIKQEGDNLVLSKDEVGSIFGATKPVYSGRLIDKNDDVVYREYVKVAAFPLLPQFTKGLELDKLRKSMEALERKKGMSVRAVFDSGTKLGGRTSVNIWNDDGTLRSDLDLEANAIVLDRANFGEQQPVPYDEEKDEIVKSTQETKLLFDALLGSDGFRFGGNSLSGKELYQIYEDLHKKIYEEGLKKLEEAVVQNGQLHIPSLSKMLIDEGINRGYSAAQLSFLQLNEEKTNFKIPFWAHIANEKEQALITSLYSNNIIKQRMPGASYVLVSEEGTKGKSLGITYVKKKDGEDQTDYSLKPMRIAYRKGGVTIEKEQYDKLSSDERKEYGEVVKPAQVIVPWNVRGKSGKLLKIENFLTEEGYIDTKKLPKEILTQFGFRIPNQGHHSMALIEVIGFLPDVYNGVVIASRNFIAQMGSDFDVDKLYIYQYYTDVDDEGKVIKTNDLKNSLLDVHKSVLYNPKAFDYVTKPLDLGELKYTTNKGKVEGVAQELKRLYTKPSINYLDPTYDKNKYLESVDGKSMVAINAVGNTFLSIIQDRGLYLRKRAINEEGKQIWVTDYIVFSDKNGNKVELTDLSSAFGLNGHKKTENKSAYLSAAVDNEKDPILSYLNHSPQTAPVEALLIALGLDAELSLFTAQPVIREFVKQVKLSRSILSQEFKREATILTELAEDYSDVIEKLRTKFDIETFGELADQPIGPIHFRQVLYNTQPEKVGNLPPLSNREIQALVLLKFEKIYRYGDIYSRAQGLLNIKDATKSILELSDKRTKIDEIIKPGAIGNLHAVVGDYKVLRPAPDAPKLSLSALVPSTLTGYLLENGIYSADDTIRNSDLMPYSFRSFTEIVKEHEDITNKEATADNKYEIWQAIKSYIFSDAFSVQERERIFFDRNDNKSLNTRIHNLLKTKLKNNPFLLRLDLSKVNVDGKLPSLIFYNAAKEEDIEESSIYQGLLDLVYSQDLEVKAIGVDLIKYFYINGGNQAAKEWGRYMDPKMVEEVKLDNISLMEFIQNVNLHYSEVLGDKLSGQKDNFYLADSLLQLYQHKPYLAPKAAVLPEEWFKKEETEIAIPVDNLPFELQRGADRGVKVFTRKDKKGKTRIYKLSNKDEAVYTYIEIPRLGANHYNEYQRIESVNGVSIIPQSLIGKPSTKQEVNSVVAQTTKITPKEVSRESIRNPLITQESIGLVNVTLNESLSNINSNKYHETLSTWFQQLGPVLDEVTIEAVNSEGNFFGQWVPDDRKGGVIRINLQKLGEYNKLTKEYIEETILKEVIHVANSQAVRKGPTSKQEAALNALKTIYDSLRERVANGEFESIGWKKDEWIKFQEILEKHRKKEPVTTGEIDFLSRNKGKYYGLTHIEDFMHDVLLQPEFRDILNKIPHSSKKSFLDRIGELLFEILQGFRGLITIKQDSVLEEAFGQIFKLTKNEEQEIKDIASQYDEEVRNPTIEPRDLAIARIINKVSLESLKRYGDINQVSSDIRRFYVGKGGKGRGLDVIAQDASALFNPAGDGTEITPDDVWNFILTYPTGPKTTLTPAGNPKLKELADKYYKLTGKTINKQIARNKSGDADQLGIKYDIVSGEIGQNEKQVYAKILNDFDVRLTRIAKDISRAYGNKDFDLVAGLKNRYEEVQAEKNELIDNNTFETIVNTANNDLKYVEDILNKENLQLNDILYAEIVLGTWTDIDNVKIYSVITPFDVENSTKRFEDVNAIASKARTLDIKLDAIKVGRFKEMASQEVGKEISEEELTRVTDISYLQAQTRDISTSDNIILSVVDKWMRKADFNAVGDLNSLNDRLDGLFKAVQENSDYKEGGFSKVFGQENEDGELTGELVDALKYEYYKTREQLLTEIDIANTPLAKRDAAKKYYEWIRDNHIIVDLSKIYKVEPDGTLTWKPDNDYLKALEQQLGEDYEKTVDKAKKLAEEYNDDLKTQIKYFEGVEDGAIKLDMWKVGNSPLIYIDNLKNGLTARKVAGKYIKNQGWKYISKRVISKWEDEKYNTIQKDTALREYYEFYRATLKELYQYLPYNLRKSFKPTEIPNINKDLIEELTQVGVGKSWNRIWSKFLENISVTNKEPSKTINPVTKDFQKDFKFSYLDKIDPKKKSYDLNKVLRLFATQAIGYKYKAQVEDAIRLADSILREAVEKRLDPDGSVSTDKFGSVTTTKGLENLQKQFDYAFDAFLGNRKEQREGVTNMRFITPKDKEELQKEIDIINQNTDLEETTKKSHIAAAKEKYYRRFAWGRLGDQLLQWVQLKGMGWNVFAGINNAVFGQMANFNWAASGVDFDDKDMIKALQTMLSYDKTTEKKIRALMTRFNTVKQLRDFVHKATTNYNRARSGIQKLHPFELYAKGEYFIQGQVMVALLEHTKVEVEENGEKKTISLFEALDENGNWDSKRFGEKPEWNRDSNNSKEFKNKLDDLLKKIHGNYDPNAAMLANKKFIGRALLQFRRWIPEGVAQRFDSEKYNIHLQRNTKGRYLTYGDLGFRKSVKVLLDMVLRRGDKAFEGITDDAQKLEIIKENMKKNLREIYYKLSLVGLALTLSLDDDDTEATKAAKNYLLNTAIRLQDDIAFFYSPMAFENITRSAVPAATIIVDAWEFMLAVADTLEGEGTYKTGRRAGDSKVVWRGMRMLPLGTAITGLIGKLEAADERTRRK